MLLHAVIIVCFSVLITHSSSASSQLLFTVATKGAVWGTPIFYDGILYVSSYDKSIVAVNAQSGSVLWSASSTNSVRGSLVVDALHGGIIDVSLAGTIVMRSLKTGQEMWKHQRKSYTWVFSPSLVGKMLFVPMRNDDLIVLDTDSGRLLGTLPQSSGVWAAPVIVSSSSADAGQVVLAVTAGATVTSSRFERNAKDGNVSFIAPRWTHDTVPGATHYKQRMHAWIFGSVATCKWGDTDAAVFGSNDRKVRAVSLTTGQELWTARGRGKISSTPVAAVINGNSFPIVVTESGDITCFGQTGEIRWQSSVRQSVASSVGPSIANNVVVVGGLRGAVIGIDGSNGATLFQFDLVNCAVRSNPGIQFLSDSSLLVAVGCESGVVHVTRVNDVKKGAALIGGKTPQLAKPEQTLLNRLTQVMAPSPSAVAAGDISTPTTTPLLVLVCVSFLSGFLLYLRRNHLKKSKP